MSVCNHNSDKHIGRSRSMVTDRMALSPITIINQGSPPGKHWRPLCSRLFLKWFLAINCSELFNRDQGAQMDCTIRCTFVLFALKFEAASFSRSMTVFAERCTERFHSILVIRKQLLLAARLICIRMRLNAIFFLNNGEGDFELATCRYAVIQNEDDTLRNCDSRVFL